MIEEKEREAEREVFKRHLILLGLGKEYTWRDDFRAWRNWSWGWNVGLPGLGILALWFFVIIAIANLANHYG